MSIAQRSLHHDHFDDLEHSTQVNGTGSWQRSAMIRADRDDAVQHASPGSRVGPIRQLLKAVLRSLAIAQKRRSLQSVRKHHKNYEQTSQKVMETTVRMISNAPPVPQAMARQSWVSELIASLERRWSAYLAWRLERAAINQLSSQSDRQLKDIGLDRSEIMGTVRNRITRGHTLSRYH